MQWREVKEADAYAVFRLGDKHLELESITPDTHYVFPTLEIAESFFAVAPLIEDKPGIMSRGLDIEEQQVGCILNQFFFKETQGDKAVFQYNLGWLPGIKDVRLYRIIAGDTIEINSKDAPTELINLIQSDPLQEGPNFFQLQLELTNGKFIYSQVEIVYFLQHASAILWPNPVQPGDLVGVYSSSIQAYDLIVSDITGKAVFSLPYQSNPVFITLPELAAGIYLITLRYEDNSQVTQRLFIR